MRRFESCHPSHHDTAITPLTLCVWGQFFQNEIAVGDPPDDGQIHYTCIDKSRRDKYAWPDNDNGKNRNCLCALGKAGNIKEVFITDVWSVTYEKGDYQATHNHSSTGLSGILQLESPTDGPSLNIIMPWNDWIDDTTRYYSVKYKGGTMVIMPSFLLHSSEPNLSNQRKRVVSWDMKVE